MRRTVSLIAGLCALVLTAAPAAAQGAEGLTKADRTGPVTVQLTPVPPGSAGDPLKIRVALDTHSVDLDAIRLERAVLVQSGPSPVAPLGVESATGGGHHRQAVLVFPASVLAGEAKALEVVVKDVGGVPERRFRWDLPLVASPGRQPAQPGAGQMGQGTMMGEGMMMGPGMMGPGTMMGIERQMMGMMQQMGGMLQQMGELVAGGQLSREQMEQAGEMMQQMGGMMADMGAGGGMMMRGMMMEGGPGPGGGMGPGGGAMSGGRAGSGPVPDVARMMERMAEMQRRMAEMQKRMSEMMQAPR